jgi:tetratricopeptide (TPR) repeat protein
MAAVKPNKRPSASRVKSAPLAAATPIKLPKHLFAVAALLLLVWVAYRTSLDNGFVWDDHELVVKNSDVQTGTLSHIFSTGAWSFQQHAENAANNNYYRPLQILTYRITASLGSLSPWPFHLASLLLHLGATLLCYAVFYKLLQSATTALAGAAIFALHPVHAEAIDWIACSTELGCGLFLLLSFYCYLYIREGRYVASIASLVSFLAALLWKEMAATLPLLITAHILLLDRKRNIVKTTAPYWGVLLLYLVLRHNALGVFYASSASWTLGPAAFISTVLQLIATYWWKLIWPVNLNAYYVFEPGSWAANLLYAATIGAAIALIVYCYKRHPLAAFACIWIFLALLPVLNVYHLGSNIFGERYLYIPSVGFALLCALPLKSLNRMPATATLLVVLLACYTWQDLKRADDWKDDYALFSKTLQQSPRAALINRVMGDLLRTEKNDLPDAEQHYQKAITLAQESTPPAYSQVSLAYVGLAQIYGETNQTDKALKALDEAQRIDPANAGAKLARAVIYAEKEDWPDAKPILQTILAADPTNNGALNTMGLVAWQGDHNASAAVQYFERALNAGPTDTTAASIHNNLGAIYGEQHQYDQAIGNFQTAAQLDPQNPQYVTNVGNLYGMMNKPAEAKASFERALQIQSGYRPALAGLSQLQAASQSRSPNR